MDERSPEEVAADVSKYSVLVGFLLIIVFVVPCVVFALIAKKFQSQPAARKVGCLKSLVKYYSMQEGIAYMKVQ